MIDSFRPRRAPGHHLRPADKHLASQVVVGDHSRPQAVPVARPVMSPVHRPAPQFTPPTQIAAQEEQQPITSTTGALGPKPKRSFKQWLKDRTKKQWIIFSIIAVVVLIGGGVGAYFLLRQDAPKRAPVVAKTVVKQPPKPTTEASKLSGVQVDPSVNQRPVTAVMIENSLDARPQSSLEQASVVFEAIAEGGITRFLALFQDTTPSYIGPVRSVRPYYLQWLMGFDGAVAHVGGSPDALGAIKTWGTKDLDQFFNAGAYHRIASRDAPHNVYTSIAELNDIETQKGFGAANFTGFTRKAEQPNKTPGVTKIDFNISSADFNSHFDYDPAANNYKRSQDGSPHMQINENGVPGQIVPKVVVALIMQQGLEADGKHLSYATIGTGHVFVFQDGNVIEGNWHKNSNAEQITFTDMNNAPIALNPGQTWLTVLGGSDRVSYKP